LRLNITPNDLGGNIARSSSEIPARPEGGQFFESRVFDRQLMRSNRQALLNDIGGRRRRKGLHQEMNMIGFNSQFDNAPSVFFTLGLDQGLATPGHLTSKNGLWAFRCPDKGGENAVDGILISFVTVVFQVCKYIINDRLTGLLIILYR
jgi:hypothetical protein